MKCIRCREICHFWSIKGPKKLSNAFFFAVRKSFSNYGAFTAVKRDAKW